MCVCAVSYMFLMLYHAQVKGCARASLWHRVNCETKNYTFLFSSYYFCIFLLCVVTARAKQGASVCTDCDHVGGVAVHLHRGRQLPGPRGDHSLHADLCCH